MYKHLAYFVAHKTEFYLQLGVEDQLMYLVNASLTETSLIFICLNRYSEQLFFSVYCTWDIKLWTRSAILLFLGEYLSPHHHDKLGLFAMST